MSILICEEILALVCAADQRSLRIERAEGVLDQSQLAEADSGSSTARSGCGPPMLLTHHSIASFKFLEPPWSYEPSAELAIIFSAPHNACEAAGDLPPHPRRVPESIRLVARNFHWQSSQHPHHGGEANLRRCERNRRTRGNEFFLDVLTSAVTTCERTPRNLRGSLIF